MDVTVWYYLLTLMVLTHKGVPKSYRSSYGEYDYYSDNAPEPPIFTARSQTFTVEVGQSVIIPCDFTNAGQNKLIIKKILPNGAGDKILSVDAIKVATDPRLAVSGPRLTIAHTRPRDAGTFLCHFDLTPPVQLRHKLDVQYSPSVRGLVAPEQHVARGSSVTLQCEATGNPEPIIRWSRQEGKLPSGHHSSQGAKLTLDNVDRHAEGTFLCTADNGIGDPASAAMAIIIEYPPEVSPEKAVVRTGEGDQVELVCIVHGRPPPDVVWTHDGRPLPDTMMDTQLHLPSRTHSAHNNNNNIGPHSHSLLAHRHSLSINPVKEKDFGAYVCIAENAHGQKNAIIQMTALPEPPKITSSPNGGESTRYTLTWDTESYYAITDYIIKYRKTHLGVWQPNQNVVMAGSWWNVSGTVDPPMQAFRGLAPQSMAHTLANLDVATDYVAVVRVRNKYGWSSESQHFQFSTKKAMAVLQSTSSGAGSLVTAVSLVLAPCSLLLLAPWSLLSFLHP